MRDLGGKKSLFEEQNSHKVGTMAITNLHSELMFIASSDLAIT